MNRAILLCALLAGFLGIASCGDSVPNAGRVVATVNGKNLTYDDLIRQLEKQRGAEVLVKLIDEVIIREEARKRNITLSPEERKAGLERAAARVGSMADLKMRLQQSGIPLEAYQQQIETDLLLDRIAAQEVNITDQEIERYYAEHRSEFERGERVHSRMMLFGDQASAEAVREALREPGADFAGLARSLSQDSATRDSGGDMGWFERSDYAPEITNVAFKLQVGQVSDPIKTPDGWALVKVEGRKPAGPLALEEVKDQIRQRLQREKQEEARGQWLVKARAAAQITVGRPGLAEAVQALLQVAPPPPLPGQP